MINYKLFVPILRKLRFRIVGSFSKRKGLEQNIKQKQNKKFPQENNSEAENENLSQLAKMKILNMQFYPISIFLAPSLFYFDSIYDPNFLLGQVMTEKYASLALLMNLDLKGSKTKTIAWLTLMASLHALTGYYSLITPFGMAFLTMISSFKFCNEKEKYTQIQSTRLRTMTHIRMVYFFLFIFLTLLKAYHYEAIYSIEKKLDQFNSENFSNISLKENV